MKYHQAVLRHRGPIHARQFYSRLAGYNSRVLCGLPAGLSNVKLKKFDSSDPASCKRCSKAYAK